MSRIASGAGVVITQDAVTRVLLLASQDAYATAMALTESGFDTQVCVDLEVLAVEAHDGAGAVIMDSAALEAADLSPWLVFLESQPTWSDLPVVLLVPRGVEPRLSTTLQPAEVLGNVRILERPHEMHTLIATLRYALRSRRRQYYARTQEAERNRQLLTEIAVRERAQEQLLESQKIESVGQLTGGIAHDFNNLLMAVLGNLEILRKRLPDDPGLRRLLDGAMQGAQRGSSLTQRLLAFARQQDLRTVPVDVGTLLGGMAELLRRSLGPHVELNLRIEPNLPPAEIDGRQVELAILNLAINAREAMSDGGLITISVDQKQIADERRLRGGTYIRIQVADTGAGMDPCTLHKAIEPFFSTKPLGKGTGLGLSMTHGLAVQLGGRLDLASEPGAGTVATLWLPMATAPVGAAQPTERACLHRRATILVVDDDPLIAMSTIDMLEDLGHTAIEANSGLRALEILENGIDIDLLVTDQLMPGMTGIQLAEIVRSKRPRLPVLLATGFADLPTDKLANLPRLSKPYRQAQLQAEIDKLLSPA